MCCCIMILFYSILLLEYDKSSIRDVKVSFKKLKQVQTRIMNKGKLEFESHHNVWLFFFLLIQQSSFVKTIRFVKRAYYSGRISIQRKVHLAVSMYT